MNKEPYTTNRRVQLLWNSSTAIRHTCNPTSWTHLPHTRGEMQSLDIQKFRSHIRFIVWFIHGSRVGILFSAQCLRAERQWTSYSVVNAVNYVENDCTNQSTYPPTGQHPHIGPSSWRCTKSSAVQACAWNLWHVKSECTVSFIKKPQNSHWHNYGRLTNNVKFSEYRSE